MRNLLVPLFFCVTILTVQSQGDGVKLPGFLNALNGPLKTNSSSKSSNESAPVHLGFEQTYRNRVAMFQKLGDTIHDGFNNLTNFLLLFVGKDSRSLLSIKNVNEMKTLGLILAAITKLSTTLIKDLTLDSRSFFSAFITRPTKIIKFVFTQVLKALPIPQFVLNFITKAVNKVL